MGAFVRADSLAGSVVADSPLVRRQQTVAFGVAMSWVLWRSERLVPDRDELR
jgi:outer membrane scaffolding protein for murein synthesis (MipA/OmpV family)